MGPSCDPRGAKEETLAADVRRTWAHHPQPTTATRTFFVELEDDMFYCLLWQVLMETQLVDPVVNVFTERDGANSDSKVVRKYSPVEAPR